ncbi:MAG TPA: hypothetical protein VJK71_00340 [Gemmatimonadales bacterium]|nr:hypothetical protein [Gemmatimonadales bacterium]
MPTGGGRGSQVLGEYNWRIVLGTAAAAGALGGLRAIRLGRTWFIELVHHSTGSTSP